MKKHYIISFISFFIMTLIGCSSESNNGNAKYKFKSEERKGAIREIILEDQLLGPVSIAVYDSIMVLRDISEPPFFHIYNINSGKAIAKFGTRGQGPEDYNAPTQVDIDTRSREIMTFDVQSKLYRTYSLDTIIKNGVARNTKSIRFPVEIEDPRPINDSIFITLGSFEKGMYAICNKGEIVKTEFDYPGEINLPDIKKAFIFDGKLKVSPDKTKLAYAALFCDVIEIFNIKNGNMEKIKTLFTFLPEYSDGSNGDQIRVAVKHSTPMGYLDLFAGDNYIYALYNGRTKEAFKDRYFYGNQIHIFDWEGNPVKNLIVDRDIRALSVDETNNLLYTISYNINESEDPGFHVYKIDK